MSRPSFVGSRTDDGRSFATASSRPTSPRRTMSARSADVNTLVADPISNTVSPSSGRAVPSPADPTLTTVRFPVGSIIPTTMPRPG
jgi:hypothetical protein